ncbi:hypothetical protein GCM10018962_62580 [Dactylosporangium matsuzakiense]
MLRGRATGQVPVTTPSASTSTAPSAPRLARTVPAPPGAQLLGGGDDVAQVAEGGPDDLGQLVPVGLEQCGPGRGGLAQGRAAGVHGDPDAGRGEAPAQLGVGVGGQPGRDAAAQHDPVG